MAEKVSIYVLLHIGNKQQQIITLRHPMLPATSATQEESVSIWHLQVLFPVIWVKWKLKRAPIFLLYYLLKLI